MYDHEEAFPARAEALYATGQADDSTRLDALAAPYDVAAAEALQARQAEPLYATGPAARSVEAGPRRQAAPSRPLRVAHVGQFMVRGGIESWLKSFIRYSDPQRLQWVRCVVTNTVADTQVMRELGIPVEVGQDALRQSAQDCDVLLISSPGEVEEWLGELRPGLCVFVAHGDSHWSRDILLGSRSLVEHVVAVSRNVRASVAHDFPSSVIYNGVDLAHLTASQPREATRTALGFAADDFVLGFVGRFAWEKRPEVVLEAVARLPRRFKALMVGWGPYRQKLMDLANHLVPGRFAFLRASHDLGDLYRAMDAFCLASASEGFGLAMLEAMLCGVPVIAGRMGFAPEKMTHRVNGVLVDGAPESIAKAAQLLADHPGWASAVALEGRRLAEEFGYARRMCREYEDLLHRLWTAKHGAL
jgi:glycosyltransferase involved in cell wall biosynthesis